MLFLLNRFPIVHEILNICLPRTKSKKLWSIVNYQLLYKKNKIKLQIFPLMDSQTVVKFCNLCCQAEYVVHCPTSLGALLLVRLETPPTTASFWFCSKVTVTTPEGGVSLFPCYRFISCSTSLALRDSIGWFKMKFLALRVDLMNHLFCFRFIEVSVVIFLFCLFSQAKFVFNDVQPIELDQRMNELTYRRQRYR